jgi:hypothetical protein
MIQVLITVKIRYASKTILRGCELMEVAVTEICSPPRLEIVSPKAYDITSRVIQYGFGHSPEWPVYRGDSDWTGVCRHEPAKYTISDTVSLDWFRRRPQPRRVLGGVRTSGCAISVLSALLKSLKIYMFVV